MREGRGGRDLPPADSAPLALGSYARMTVGCLPGERLIGGGAGFPFAPAPTTGNEVYDLYQQVATSAPGILVNPAEVNPHPLTVYAVCATP